jgi:hypothetical protein
VVLHLRSVTIDSFEEIEFDPEASFSQSPSLAKSSTRDFPSKDSLQWVSSSLENWGDLD